MWRKFCCITHQAKLNAGLFILLFFTCLCNSVFAQRQTYELRKIHIVYGSVSLLSFGAFYGLQQKVTPLTELQVNALNPASIPSYDRVAIHHYDITARKLSNILIYSSFIAKAAIFRKESKKDILAIGIVGYQTLLLSQAIANGFQLGVLRTRPYAYNPDVPLNMRTSRDARFSFFSGHTVTSSSLCFTTAFAYRMYYPESRYKKWVWASAIAIPALEGYLRVKAGKHYPSDVITGYLVGLGTSYLMHHLHKSKRK